MLTLRVGTQWKFKGERTRRQKRNTEFDKRKKKQKQNMKRYWVKEKSKQ